MTQEFEHDQELSDIIARLEAERPLPRAAFRGQLRRELSSSAERRIAPGRLRLLIGGYATSGAALLAIAAVGLAGVGPFAA